MARKTDKLAVADFPLIDETLLKSRIYTIRGVKVMLDADLAEIYGYETRFFNRQVKNNIDRFAEDFRFQLNEDEMQNLMCKKCTSSWGGTRMALIRLFKQMKDCIVENQQLIGVDELPKELLESIVGHIEFMSQHQDQAAANREAT
jgi:hypothetical protein